MVNPRDGPWMPLTPTQVIHVAGRYAQFFYGVGLITLQG